MDPRLKSYNTELSNAEMAYYAAMSYNGYDGCDHELTFVGLGNADGFAKTMDLRVMKYDEAMATEQRSDWIKSVEEEHERMVKSKVFMPVKRESLPEGTKVMTSTWAMKLKPNGEKRARVNARDLSRWTVCISKEKKRQHQL